MKIYSSLNCKAFYTCAFRYFWTVYLMTPYDSIHKHSMPFCYGWVNPSIYVWYSPLQFIVLVVSSKFLFQVTAICPLREGSPPKFSQRTQLVTANYQVVWRPTQSWFALVEKLCKFAVYGNFWFFVMTHELLRNGRKFSIHSAFLYLLYVLKRCVYWNTV